MFSVSISGGGEGDPERHGVGRDHREEAFALTGESLSRGSPGWEYPGGR